MYFLFAFSPAFSQLEGELDSTFHEDGIVTTGLSADGDAATTIAILPDGRFLVGGYVTYGTYNDFVIVRYLNNGDVDTSFGVDGVQAIEVGDYNDFLWKLIVLPDGKIIAGGYITTNPGGSTSLFAIAKLLENGIPDTEFGVAGIAYIDFGYSEQVLLDGALQDDGKLVFTGRVGDMANTLFAIARLEMDGSLDMSFDDDGKLTTGYPLGSSGATSIAVQPDQKIVVGGYAYTMDEKDFKVIRLLEDGSFDPDFGVSGEVIVDIFSMEDHPSSMTLQSDGKILVAGWSGNFPEYDFCTIRLSADSLDASWSMDGICLTDMGTENDGIEAITTDSEGNVLITGNYLEGGYHMGLVRYRNDGLPDSSFGADGFVYTDIPLLNNEQVNDIAVFSDGKILIAGSAGMHFALQRFIGRSQLDCDSIIQHPADVFSTPTSDVYFSVSTSGTTPEYQWQSDLGFGWNDLSDAGQYSGTNNDTLWVNNVNTMNDNQLFRALLTTEDCPDTSLIATLHVDAVVIDENIHSNPILLYPNPFHNQLTIQLSSFDADTKLSTMDITGKLISDVLITSEPYDSGMQFTIRMPDGMQNGLYLIQIAQKNAVCFQTVLKL